MKRQEKLEMWAECGDDFYYGRDGEEIDYELAFGFYEKAAKKKHPYSLYRLGRCYELGRGVAGNMAQARACYEAASALGNEAAGLRLKNPTPEQDGRGALYGVSPAVTVSLAVELYKREEYEDAFDAFYALASAGQIEAQYRLGVMYARGEGVRASGREAAQWYEKAAQAGHEAACYHLAVLCCGADGVKKDLSKALYWYERAAGKGNSAALHAAAEMYYEGIGTVRDLHRAFAWFLHAAEKGDAEAQYRTALMYERGEGVEQNRWEAQRWMTEAAEQGGPAAQAALAEYILAEEDTAAAKRRAQYWYRKAAAFGFGDADLKAEALLPAAWPDYAGYGYEMLQAALEREKAARTDFQDPFRMLAVALLMIKSARGKEALLDEQAVRAYLGDLLPAFREIRAAAAQLFETGAVDFLQTGPDKAAVLLKSGGVGRFEADTLIACYDFALRTPVTGRASAAGESAPARSENDAEKTAGGPAEYEYDEMDLETLSGLAAGGDAEALYVLATRYMAGECLAGDDWDMEAGDAAARACLQQASAAGHEAARGLLELLAFTGVGEEFDGV